MTVKGSVESYAGESESPKAGGTSGLGMIFVIADPSTHI